MRTLWWWLVFTIPVLATAKPAEIADIEKSVVRVFAYDSRDGGVGSGSGSVIAPGVVLTNHHVVNDAGKLSVASSHIPESVASVLWSDPELDLALLKVEKLDAPPLRMSALPARKGGGVWALGFPGIADPGSGLTLSVTVSRGVVSNVYESPWPDQTRSLQLVVHDALIAPGNSGGPLFDDCGRIIGVNTLMHSGGGGNLIYFASHITAAQSEFQRLGIGVALDHTDCTAGSSVIDSAARESAEQARFMARGSLVWGLVLAVLSLTALVLSVRGSRREVVRFIEKVSMRISRPVPTASDGSATGVALALAGFGRGGEAIRLLVPGAELPRSQGGFVLGRTESLADGLIDHDTVSRRHARLTNGDGGIFVEDLNSTHGTSVNDQILKPFEPALLRPGDCLRLGEIELRVSRAP